MAASVSSEIARGRPPRRPLVAAALSPATTRSRIRARARGPIDMEVPLVDACGEKGVPLQVRGLAVIGGGDAHVADQHAGNP